MDMDIYGVMAVEGFIIEAEGVIDIDTDRLMDDEGVIIEAKGSSTWIELRKKTGSSLRGMGSST